MNELSETAVRCGIGSKAFKNAGNELFRRLVNTNRVRFPTCIFPIYCSVTFSVNSIPEFSIIFSFLITVKMTRKNTSLRMKGVPRDVL